MYKHKKRRKYFMERKNKGITLIALIITIIIMLILAGIVITMTIGENGIIAKAQLAGKNYIDASNYEQSQLAKLENYIENSRQETNAVTIKEVTPDELWETKSEYLTDSNTTITKSGNIIQFMFNNSLALAKTVPASTEVKIGTLKEEYRPFIDMKFVGSNGTVDALVNIYVSKNGDVSVYYDVGNGNNIRRLTVNLMYMVK